jgi:hypothetical protein
MLGQSQSPPRLENSRQQRARRKKAMMPNPIARPWLFLAFRPSQPPMSSARGHFRVLPVARFLGCHLMSPGV